MLRRVRTHTGHYRHLGTSLAWDEHGLRLDRPGSRSVEVPWPRVHGARLVPRDDAEVEILIQGRASTPVSLDTVALKVNSRDDAARLLTTINWQSAGARPPEPTGGRRRPWGRGLLRGWRRGWLRGGPRGPVDGGQRRG